MRSTSFSCGRYRIGFRHERLTESVVEEAALAWLEAGGWQVAHGPEIAPEMPAAERTEYGEVVLTQRLRDALARLNPDLPSTPSRTPSAS